MSVESSTDTAGSAVRTRAATLDAACADAVELARAAAVEVAGVGQVGAHLAVEADGERLATHRFASLSGAYVGWEWSVTVVRASRAKNVTVDEVCLLPGPGARLAPAWLPYADRLRPGDLGPGDLLPVPADDDRLEPGWTAGFEGLADDDTPEAEVGRLAWELGLVRNRVLSVVGLDDAADRWLNGPGGPHSALAEAAPAQCVSCGFLQPLDGLLGHAFGVCANEHSPSDGHVVTLDHGCGAHSEGGQVPSLAAASPVVLDSVGFDLLVHDASTASTAEDVEYVEDVEGVEDVEYVEDVEGVEDVEYVEDVEDVEDDAPADDALGHG